MLIVTRHRTAPDTVEAVLAAAAALVELAQAAPGFESMTVGRSPDEPDLLVVASVWADAGSARRGLTSAEVRMTCWALFACAIDEPTSFETVWSATPSGIVAGISALAADVDEVRLGEAAAPDVETSRW